ncbi:type II toxin-antitoxin system HipA family toxin [Myceligenerans indicum]|nr:HipA domain-containing protein [Myceligenerans indicum]
MTYFLESGSDRIGGLDFQASATEYQPRSAGHAATLDELVRAVDRLQSGEVLPPALADALVRGTSIGGARPKALLDDGDRRLIAKFSSTTDPYPVVKAEAVAMNLARRVGIDVPGSWVVSAAGKDVLVVERFDRPGGGRRRLMVSLLTMLGLSEMTGRYATYPQLADLVRERFERPGATLHEIFRRIVFNIATGNTDDHARNHAAFWDGSSLALTPAYDLCPQVRSGNETSQALAIGRDGDRRSRFATCIAAAEIYHLTRAEAQDIVEKQVTVIEEDWETAADEEHLTELDRKQLWHRQILNESVFYRD